MLNVERGMRRIVWVLSALGLLLLVLCLIMGIYNSIKRAELISSMKADPAFIAFSSDTQTKLVAKADEKYSLEPFIGVAVGAGWFLACWGLFFLLRWIIKGFEKDKI